MAKFLTGNALNSALESIFIEAEKELILISPFIKLHSRFRDALNLKKENDKLKITLVFGKNEDDPSKSISSDDLEFFKTFPNIEINYEPRLHAKYYANENTAIISSMNLYQYSQDNNIEAGILTETSIINKVTGSFTGEDIDTDAYDYFKNVITNSKLLFQRKANYDNGVLGMGMGKKCIGSETTLDDLKQFFGNNKEEKINAKVSKVNLVGYCIRTGKEIPFDPSKPMTYEAYQSWAKFKNPDYAEKFCHKTGKPSNGKTSMRNPILH